MVTQIIGYARVSTFDQKAGLASQREELLNAGCHRLFVEEVSSVATIRPELENALSYVREGDVLIVTKLDRLARSMADLMSITKALSAKGVSLKVLAMNLDTSTATGQLILNVLGSISEFERSLMLERQRDGIAQAKAAGRYKGRAPTARAKTSEIIQLKASGASAADISTATGVSRASVFRILADSKISVSGSCNPSVQDS